MKGVRRRGILLPIWLKLLILRFLEIRARELIQNGKTSLRDNVTGQENLYFWEEDREIIKTVNQSSVHKDTQTDGRQSETRNANRFHFHQTLLKSWLPVHFVSRKHREMTDHSLMSFSGRKFLTCYSILSVCSFILLLTCYMQQDAPQRCRWDRRRVLQ